MGCGGFHERKCFFLKIFIFWNFYYYVKLTGVASPDLEAEKQLVETRKLLARCYLKLGTWQESLQGLQVDQGGVKEKEDDGWWEVRRRRILERGLKGRVKDLRGVGERVKGGRWGGGFRVKGGR